MHLTKVFISHSWSYSEHYAKLSESIFEHSWQSNGVKIHFEDWSVPKDNPIHNANNATQLRNAIFSRIREADVVVFPTGMYVNYSKWINEEINGAKNFGKPILAVNPWGQEKKSGVVLQNSNANCGWTSDSVIKIYGY